MHLLLLHFLLPLALAANSSSTRCPPAITLDKKPQVFVMSDISNEPDDTMSFIRLLLHSDQYNITGMTAVTSYWLNSSVYPDEIMKTVRAYGKVVDNLNTHSAGEFPTEEYLASTVKTGPRAYGTAGIGVELMSSGASHLITVVDSLIDDEILHAQAWGGINTLAEALAYVQRTRPAIELDRFTRKLRIYAISDQDTAGPWIRQNFPSIPYIASIHGWNQYGEATWPGISGEEFYQFDQGGPNTSLVDQAYISENFQVGPLGSLYPDIAFIMEGDSPSLMHTMMNGLNGGPFDHPEWGGWGGRYLLQDLSRQTMLYANARDLVKGANGEVFNSNQASIWRWRQAFQDEMAARVQWSILPEYDEGSHPPVVSVNGSCGSEPLMVEVEAEQVVTLDASDSYDPDSGRNPLDFHFFQYKEPSDEPYETNVRGVPTLNFTLSGQPVGSVATMKMPSAEAVCRKTQAPQRGQQGVSVVCQEYHVVLDVTGSGEPPIRRYKRAILKVKPANEKGRLVERDEL